MRLYSSGLVTIPSILYSGSVAVLRLFDVPTLLNIDYEPALYLTVLMVGSIGSIYAVFGGLKAVVVSDTINGIGLLIIGLLVPTLGLIVLGNGSFVEGVTIVATTERKTRFNILTIDFISIKSKSKIIHTRHLVTAITTPIVDFNEAVKV